MYFGRAFHIIWNAVPDKLEQGSSSTGTAFHLSCNKAGAEKAYYKGLSGGE